MKAEDIDAVHLARQSAEHFAKRCAKLEKENTALRQRLNSVGLEWLQMLCDGQVEPDDRTLWDLATDEVKT